MHRAENYIGNNGVVAQWACKCECDESKIIIVRGVSLRSGHTKSCGCLHREAVSAANFVHGDTTSKGNKRLRSIWFHMIERCENTEVKEYKNYGGRGISVCPEWKDYIGFKDWAINNGYDKSLTLDRIDTNGNYGPDNCRWTDRKTQANNTRRNKWLTYNGETHTMAEWAEIVGMPYDRLNSRLFRGWPIEKALSTPVGNRRAKQVMGEGNE